jgi:hypothetical protein
MTTGKATKGEKYNNQMKSYKGTDNTMTKGKASKEQTMQ